MVCTLGISFHIGLLGQNMQKQLRLLVILEMLLLHTKAVLEKADAESQNEKYFMENHKNPIAIRTNIFF